MSFPAQLWAWTTPARGVKQHVLLALADEHRRDSGECRLSTAELVEKTGISERTIRRAVGDLLADGLIEIRNAGANGRATGGRRVRAQYTFVVRVETRPERPPFVGAKLVVGGTETRPCGPRSTGVEGSQTRPERPPLDDETRPNMHGNPAKSAPPDTVNPATVTPLSLRDHQGTTPGREAAAVAPPSADDGGMFEKPTTPASEARARNNLAQAITNSYQAAEPLSNRPAVLGVIRKAVDSQRYSGEEINAAALRIAADKRSLTVETLRIELNGFTPRSNGSHQNGRIPLRERLKGGAA